MNKAFLAKVQILHGNFKFQDVRLIVAPSLGSARFMMEDIAGAMYGGDVTEKVEGGYLAHGELRLSVESVVEVSPAAFQGLRAHISTIGHHDDVDRDPTPDHLDVNCLAQEIRRVDGAHNLGAAALAEALQPFLRG